MTINLAQGVVTARLSACEHAIEAFEGVNLAFAKVFAITSSIVKASLFQRIGDFLRVLSFPRRPLLREASSSR